MAVVQVGEARNGGFQLTPVMANPALGMQPVSVLLTALYYPQTPATFPTRGGLYNAGETAAFPACEAAALVAAGLATYA